MMTRLQKTRILFLKDWKDTLKNGNGMILAVLPLFFTLLYRMLPIDGMPMPREFISLIGVLMNLALVPVALLSMMIAEEKEKNTLRTLMLSNVGAVEFLTSTCLVVLVLLSVVNLAVFFLTGMALSALPLFLLVTTLTALCLMFLGAVIGLLCKNQMSTGTLASPVALLLMIPPMFAQMNDTVAKIAQFIPTYSMIELLYMNGQPKALPWMVIGVWLVGAFALFMLVYRKKRLDA